MAAFVHGNAIEALVVDDTNEPLRALRWSDSAWRRVTVTHRSQAADSIVFIEPVRYPQVAAWTGSKMLVGGSGGLAAYDPDRARFSTIRDSRIRTFGGAAVWTRKRLVASPSQNS